MLKTASKTIFDLFSILPKKYSLLIILIFSLSIISSLFDFLSIILIGKIVTLIQSKEVSQFENIYFFSSLSMNQILICFVIISLLAGLSKITFTFTSTKFAAKCGGFIAKKVFSISLRQKYIEFINTNNSNILSLINRELDNTINVLNNFFLLGSYTITSIFMISVISILIPTSLFIVLSFVPFIYIFISLILKNRILYISNTSSNLLQDQMRFSRESLDMKKEISLNKNFELFENKFFNNEIKRRLLEAEVNFKSVLPRNIIEMFFILILLFILIFYGSSDNTFVLSTIISLAISAQKLLPSFQGIYSITLVINAYSKSVDRIVKFLNSSKYSFSSSIEDKKKIETFKKISVRNLTYNYPYSKNSILKNLTLNIKQGEFIAIKGKSGAGKSTLMDLLLGLLKDSSNSITINDVYINECINSWNKKIQYVGQTIFFIDDTIYQNIILGGKDKKNKSKLSYIIDKTGLENVFKTSDLTINSRVGEYGNLISRGQRQRVGISRALYKSPNIIFLDEATNGLDFNSEKKIYQNLRDFDKLTVIAITHSNEIDNCFDKIIKLN